MLGPAHVPAAGQRVEYERLMTWAVFQPGEGSSCSSGALVVRDRRAAGTPRPSARCWTLSALPWRAWQIDSQLPRLDDASQPSPTSPWCGAIRTPYRDAHRRAPCWWSRSRRPRMPPTEYKFSLYARAAIAECGFIDVRQDCVEIHREPSVTAARYGWRYRSVETLRPPRGAAVVAPGVSIRSRPAASNPIDGRNLFTFSTTGDEHVQRPRRHPRPRSDQYEAGLLHPDARVVGRRRHQDRSARRRARRTALSECEARTRGSSCC